MWGRVVALASRETRPDASCIVGGNGLLAYETLALCSGLDVERRANVVGSAPDAKGSDTEGI